MNRLLLILLAFCLLPFAPIHAKDHKDDDHEHDHLEDAEHGDDYDEEDDWEEEEELPYTIKEILDFMKKHLPNRYKELQELKEEDDQEYQEMIEDFGWDMVWYHEVKEENPKRAEALLKAEQLEDQTWGMVEKIHDMEKGKARDAEVQKLRGILAQIFVLRLQERLADVEELEEEIREVKQLVERRKKNADKIIDRHLKELLEMEEGDDELGWW